MRINNIQNIKINNRKAEKTASNPQFAGGREIVGKLANDSFLSTLALEVPCDVGRSANAYKRGGFPEFRERITEDLVSAVFWMKGVDIFNGIFDFAGKHIAKLPATEFDVGKDALRTPFDNMIKAKSEGMSEEAVKKLSQKLSTFKFAKIVTSAILAAGFMGFVLPRLNQAITRKMMAGRKTGKSFFEENDEKRFNFPKTAKITIKDFDERISDRNNSTQSFKGLNLAHAAFMLENDPICKMLASDAGMISGRVLTARNKDEGREYFFRDVASGFFYYASVPLIYSLFQKLTGSADITSIDPVCSKQLHDNLAATLKQAGGTLGIAEFREKTAGVLTKDASNLLSQLKFEGDVISLDTFKRYVFDGKLLEKAAKMAELQPEQAVKGAVLTRQQVEDVLKNGSINTPEFMKTAYSARFKDLTNPYKYIPMKKITDFRTNMEKYIERVVKTAETENGGVVTEQILNKIQKSGFTKSALFRGIAIVVSALALGVAIPKIQYAITKIKTGNSSAPGLREFEEKKTPSEKIPDNKIPKSA